MHHFGYKTDQTKKKKTLQLQAELPLGVALVQCAVWSEGEKWYLN